MGMRHFEVGIAVRDNVEAVEFYMKVFGLELGYYEKFPDGTYMHAVLQKDGKQVFSVANRLDDFDAERQIISFGAYFANVADVQEAFSLLSEGGIVKEPIGSLPWSSCCASVIDKFGITWFLSI